MLIPYNTDAPVYYFPFATIGLIAVNVSVYMLTVSMEIDEVAPWYLVYGQGLHPLQWGSSIFLHAGLLHLLGNMLFLWGFGLVVEGKLGWWKFLLVYLGIGVGQSAIEQIVMLGSEGGSLGASAAIFGLVAIAWVWAPKNEMSCLLLIRFIPSVIEVSILTFGGLYFGWEFFMLTLAYTITGSVAGSSLLHLMGGALGLGVGIVLLKSGAVDCEGWDVFSVLSGKDASSLRTEEYINKPIPNEYQEQQEKKKGEHLQATQEQIGVFLEGGHTTAAWKLYQKMGGADSGLTLEERQLLQIIQDFHDEQQWKDSLPVMELYVRCFPEKSLRMRLRLAQLLLEQENRPGAALVLLEEIDTSSLPEALQGPHRSLLARARELQEDEDLELDSPP